MSLRKLGPQKSLPHGRLWRAQTRWWLMVFTGTLPGREEYTALKAPVDRNCSPVCAKVSWRWRDLQFQWEVDWIWSWDKEGKKYYATYLILGQIEVGSQQDVNMEREKKKKDLTLEIKHYSILNSAVYMCLWACIHLRSNTLHVSEVCWSVCVTAGLERVISYRLKPSASMSTL